MDEQQHGEKGGTHEHDRLGDERRRRRRVAVVD